MMEDQQRIAHERTIKLYPWYMFLTNTYFWMPVFILFLLNHLPLAKVLQLEAIYYAGIVLLEVPSGYFSDRIGRRPTLLISVLSLAVAYTLFLVSSGFLLFSIAQIFLAIGLSFNSGTDTSLHYDALAALGREHEYGAREAKVSKLSFFAGSVGALAGGIVGIYSLRAAYLPALLSAVVSIGIVAAMVEPHVFQKKLLPKIGFFRQILRIIQKMNHPIIAYVFAFYVLMTVLNHVPYEFYQPYLDHLMLNAGFTSGKTSLLTGIHVSVTMLLATWFAGSSVSLRDRLGLKGVFLFSAGIQTVLIAVMGMVTSWSVAIILLARAVPRGLMTAPINAAVAPLFDKEQRATYFSLQSLAGRLAFSVTLVIFSFSGVLIPGDTMTASLLLGAALGIIGFFLIAVIKQPN